MPYALVYAFADAHRAASGVEPVCQFLGIAPSGYHKHQRFVHPGYRKQPQIAVVAVARELIGFPWAAMQDLAPVEPAAPPPP